MLLDAVVTAQSAQGFGTVLVVVMVKGAAGGGGAGRRGMRGSTKSWRTVHVVKTAHVTGPRVHGDWLACTWQWYCVVVMVVMEGGGEVEEAARAAASVARVLPKRVKHCSCCREPL
jgi:hypothetical protein